MDYVVFTDEAYITANRFRSIASYSIPYSSLNFIESDLSQLLKELSIKEFKWVKLKDAKSRLCAIKMIDYVIKTIQEHNARVDVIWILHPLILPI